MHCDSAGSRSRQRVAGGRTAQSGTTPHFADVHEPYSFKRSPSPLRFVVLKNRQLRDGANAREHAAPVPSGATQRRAPTDLRTVGSRYLAFEITLVGFTLGQAGGRRFSDSRGGRHPPNQGGICDARLSQRAKPVHRRRLV